MIRRTAAVIIFLLLILMPQLSALDNTGIRELLDETTVRIDLIDSGAIYSFGSGFLVSETGMILTNFHVIEDSLRYALPIRVKLKDGSTYEAEIIHWNAHRDWAVLHVYSSRSFPYLEFEESVEILDDIWAAGFPITGNFKITAGMVNSFQPDFMGDGLDYYDVSMNFDEGNSGGPVINRDGNVIGIVVAYLTEARAFDLIIPINDIAEEIYWLRYLDYSEAYIPSDISGVEEVGYLSDYFTVVNSTGYELWYLFMVTEEMWNDDDWGIDLLDEDVLYPGAAVEIVPGNYDYLNDPIYVDWGKALHLIAEDLDGDYYYKEWYPDFDSWEIILTFDDRVLE